MCLELCRRAPRFHGESKLDYLGIKLHRPACSTFLPSPDEESRRLSSFSASRSSSFLALALAVVLATAEDSVGCNL